ncbi:hypothetical protein [Shinella sp. M31]|uniref:hypothetical protein n=1 Tax=Shinella sp. M31 TaxID=3368615 RepID=UPI003B9FA798
MTRALAIVRADKLRAQIRCPVCGAARTDAIGKSGTPAMYCVYVCSAEFQVANAEIIPSVVCPNSSYVAARTLNEEALAEVRKVAGAA